MKTRYSAATKNVLIFFISLFIILLFNSCQSEQKQVDSAYIAEINEWHKGRIERLTQPDGWLSLAGLFWLKEGSQTIGAAPSNDIVFPEKAPAEIGVITLTDGELHIKILPGIDVKYENMPVQEMRLQSDADGKPTKLESGSLNWYIIKRGEKYAIRLKDSQHQNIANFTEIERFPVDDKWRVTARLIPYDPPKSIEIPNILGTIDTTQCIGTLEFQIDGKAYRIDPVGDMDDDEWFLIFGDKTNGEITYGAGRFLYVPRPDENGETVIDFNKSYCPPCAFTEFATCPLPPTQNQLDLAITAGEKNYEHGTH